MKKKLFLLILIMAVPLLFATAWYMSEQSFQLSLNQEKQRAQWTESIIFQEVQPNMNKLSFSQASAAAKQYRNAYAAQGVELMFCWNMTPLADASLPTRYYEGLLRGNRAALLDTLSAPQRYAVAEPINDRLTLIFLRDVSGLFTLRNQFRVTALAAALAASLLLALLGLLAAGFFTRPLRRLTEASHQLSQDSGADLSLPTERKDEIGELASAFSRMRQAVKSREDALREESDSRQMLLDALAHEMRTPLTSLLGNARLLQKDLSPTDRERIGDGMVKEIRRLSDMDQQLMKLTQLRHEALEVSEVSVLPLLKDTAARLASEEHPITVEGEDVILRGDAALLSLLMDNLTVNAIRASEPGQEIVLAALPDGFSVTDHGIGMTEEQIAHACEPFWRADKARTRSLGGAGLGLSLCRRIADLHGGELVFSSECGKGTVVQFMINDKRSDNEGIRQKPSPGRGRCQARNQQGS